MFNEEPNNYSCPFCRIKNAGLENDSDFIYQSENVFVLMALHQHEASGPTLLVIPKQHTENIYDMPDNLLSEVAVVTKFIAIKMRELWPIDGISIRQHNESAGDQDVWHFHMHIKGRLKNDSLHAAKNNEMPAQERAALAQALKLYIQNT